MAGGGRNETGDHFKAAKEKSDAAGSGEERKWTEGERERERSRQQLWRITNAIVVYRGAWDPGRAAAGSVWTGWRLPALPALPLSFNYNTELRD